MQPGFVRIEGPEEITPPIARSQDSWSAAKALCSQFPPSAPPPDSQLPVSVSVANDAALTDQPSSPGSPSLAAAAAMLQQVQSTDRDRLEEAEGAVDCLMQLSSDGTAKPSLVQSPKKRPLADDADALKPASRRKLKMKSSPLSEPRFGASAIEHAQPSQSSSMQPVALLSSSNPAQVSPSPRPRVRHRTHMQNRVFIWTRHRQHYGTHRPLPAQRCRPSTAPPPPPPPPLQLKLLAAAFKLCPTPTGEQLAAIASRVGMDEDTLANWFQSRRVLQEWVSQQPQVSSSSMRSMFYKENGGNGGGGGDQATRLPPSLVPLSCV